MTRHCRYLTFATWQTEMLIFNDFFLFLDDVSMSKWPKNIHNTMYGLIFRSWHDLFCPVAYIDIMVFCINKRIYKQNVILENTWVWISNEQVLIFIHFLWFVCYSFSVVLQMVVQQKISPIIIVHFIIDCPISTQRVTDKTRCGNLTLWPLSTRSIPFPEIT